MAVVAVSGLVAEATNNALLASYVLRTFGEMKRTSQGATGLPQPSEMDLIRLEILQQLLISSWHGAEEMQGLLGGEQLVNEYAVPQEYAMPEGSTSEYIQAYDLVQRIRGNGRSVEDLVDFASQSANILGKLREDQAWRLTNDEAAFVDEELKPFLRKLQTHAHNVRHRSPDGWLTSHF